MEAQTEGLMADVAEAKLAKVVEKVEEKVGEETVAVKVGVLGGGMEVAEEMEVAGLEAEAQAVAREVVKAVAD